MKLDILKSQTLFNTLVEGRKVNTMVITQDDVNNVCHTINKINGLSFGKAVLTDYLVDEYEIPTKWKDLIQPSRIMFSSDSLALDYKDLNAYNDVSAQIGELLSPNQFKLIWNAIVGSYRGKESSFESVKEARKDAALTEVAKVSANSDRTLCINNGVFIPKLTTIYPYESIAYNTNIDDMFVKFVLSVIIQ